LSGVTSSQSGATHAKYSLGPSTQFSYFNRFLVYSVNKQTTGYNRLNRKQI
jgi:hypothetical protein